jgi:hypothetical protein
MIAALRRSASEATVYNGACDNPAPGSEVAGQ